MRRSDSAVIVATHIRLFAEGAAITLFLGTLAIWAVVLAGRLPA